MAVLAEIQSYGAGVQSRALLHLCFEGELELPERVVFADTQSEPEFVYQVIEEDKKLCEERGVPFDVVSLGNLGTMSSSGGTYVPAFVVSGDGKGMMRRQCTQAFKQRPIKRHLRSVGYAKANGDNPVSLWLGISTDEMSRMRGSGNLWLRHRFPLVELGMSRSDCDEFLRARGLLGAKSACVFCPYRSKAGWVAIKQNPRDWAQAVEYDKAIRDARPDYGKMFVHQSLLPLEEAPIFVDDDEQPGLFEGEPVFDECEGYCGM